MNVEPMKLSQVLVSHSIKILVKLSKSFYGPDQPMPDEPHHTIALYGTSIIQRASSNSFLQRLVRPLLFFFPFFFQHEKKFAVC